MLNISYVLDPYTTYKIVLNKVEKRSKVLLIYTRIRESEKPEEIVHYTKKDLEDYWNSKNNMHMTYLKITYTEVKHSKRYLLIDNINGLIFIPLTDKNGNIVDYGFTSLRYLDRVETQGFTRIVSTTGKKYIKCKTTQTLHELIFGEKAGKGFKLDHINSDGLDNRSENIRRVTNLENTVNIDTSKKLIGITWRPNSEKWEAGVNIGDKFYSLGSFKDKIEAAKQYDRFSVHLYPDIKQLNQIDGKTLLTIEEIQEVKDNHEKYHKFLYRNDKPKKNIRKTQAGTFQVYKSITRFFNDEEIATRYLKNFKIGFENINSIVKTKIEKKKDLHYFSVDIFKSLKTLELAKEFYEKLKDHIKDLDQKEKKRLEDDIDKYRDEDGKPFLIASNNDKIVPIGNDGDWLTFIHYTWYFDYNGYPTNDAVGDLHIAIFKKHFPDEYKNKKDNESVDHINKIRHDARIENLRLSDSSLQLQNRDVKKNSLVQYPCVQAVDGGFYAVYKGDREPIKYETAEDASRKYNELAYADNPGSRLNDIPDKRTTFADIFGLENLKTIDIDSIKTISDMKEIFKFNGWCKGSIPVGKMILKDMDIYKKILVEKINENQSNNNIKESKEELIIPILAPFSIENLKKLNIDEIKTLKMAKEIIGSNNWNKGLFALNKMTFGDLDKYKQLIKQKLET